jgi:two-component system cell cycle response regulator
MGTMSHAPCIILVDPATDVTAVLAERLRMQGYTVRVAEDPADGARQALAEPPAAVVADLWMPSISGVQLCRLLNAEPATENVPVILRGPDGARNRFWAERAGAAAYVTKGRMGDLVRALAQAIAATKHADDFFTALPGGGDDIRERIAAHLDAALFESVLAAEVRALGTCGAFDRLFDLFSQFVSRVTSYRWLAVSTQKPSRLGLHANPTTRVCAEAEARRALSLDDVVVSAVEDDDAFDDASGPQAIVREVCLGTLAVGRLAIAPRQPMDAKDVRLIEVIARELAGPIRMATLVEESQRLATVDALTGLMNRRAFTAALDGEIVRACRYAHPLGFVLIDVDHFKLVNDRRGHKAGDAVLAALGRHLGGVIRRCDIVARWGGEEFVVGLPSTAGHGAKVFADRLRQSIEDMDVRDDDGERIPVTVSVGLAHLEHGDSLETLVDRADRAMYKAKSTGRNRVVVADPILAAPEEGGAMSIDAA